MNRKVEDEDYEKPSKHKQWRERSRNPTTTRSMTTIEIEEHRKNLVNSYNCADNEISIAFEKIKDENDEDRDDCIWLKYLMDNISADGVPNKRIIFPIKIRIPESIRRKADKKMQDDYKPKQRAMPALEYIAPITSIEPPMGSANPRLTLIKPKQIKGLAGI